MMRIDENKIDKIIGLCAKYEPKKIGMFGSYARNEANDESDLDILISFQGKINFFEIAGLEQELEEELNMNIDLITEKSLNPMIAEYILDDLVVIHER